MEYYAAIENSILKEWKEIVHQEDCRKRLRGKSMNANVELNTSLGNGKSLISEHSSLKEKQWTFRKSLIYRCAIYITELTHLNNIVSHQT